DGCDQYCRYETTPEKEPNNTCPPSNNVLTLGTTTRHGVITGTLATSDTDFHKITLSNYADLSLAAFDGLGPSSCQGTLDPQLTFLSSSCVVQQTSVAGGCTAITARDVVGMRHLAPGTYIVEATSATSATAFGYTVEATLNSVCGDHLVQGYEECDISNATCNADCTLAKVCGNSHVEPGEQCDDGNAAAGDGCSAT